MPRPPKLRWLSQMPFFVYFKPRGIPITELEEVVLTTDELEVIKLNDLEGLYQEDAARLMNISRQTFGRILISARRKVADFIVNGKTLKIEGDANSIYGRYVFCNTCGNVLRKEEERRCPNCKDKLLDMDEIKVRGWGRCWRRRRGMFCIDNKLKEVQR